MKDYNNYLSEKFKDLPINLVKHDTSPCGVPAFIEVSLPKMPAVKDRGTLVLDLGNYISRTFGLGYEMCPEYVGKGKSTKLRFYMSWRHLEPIRGIILKKFDKERMLRVEQYLPFEFRSLKLVA